MKKYVLLIAVLPLTGIAFGQKKFTVNKQAFFIKNKKADNEWGTKDDVQELYIQQKGKAKLVVTYYAFKDEGGDSNNLFWDKEWLKVKGNTIIITTHHFQKTGIDPITEWEKKTFTVSKNGEVELTEHLFKKRGSNTWTTE